MNRQSKVQEYQGPNLPSGVTGVPAASRAGEIYTAAGEKLVNAFKERQDKADTLAGMAVFGDAQAKAMTAENELQKQYRDKPLEYARAAKESTEKIFSEFSKGMTAGQAQKFNLMKANYLVQQGDNWNRWGVAREQEINIGNGLKSYQNQALAAQAAQTPEAFGQAMAGFEPISQNFQSFVSPATDMAYKEKYKKDAIENHMASRAFYDATGLHRDLASGGYSPLVEAKVLDASDINKYTLLAKQQMVKFAEIENYQGLITSVAEISDLIAQEKSGTLDPADVNRRLAAAKANQGVLRPDGSKMFSDEYVRNLEQMRARVLGEKKLTDPQWQTKHDMALRDFDIKQKMFFSKKNHLSPKDYDEVIGMYADLSEYNDNGWITDEEMGNRQLVLETRLKAHVDPSGRSGTLSEALKNAGKYRFWDNPGDVYAKAYEAIDNYIEKRGDLSEADKATTRQQFLVTATKMLDKMSPEQKASWRSGQAKEATIHKLMHGETSADGKFTPGLIQKLSVYKNPIDGRPMMVGDTITGPLGQVAVFNGFNEKGTPMVRLINAKRNE